MTDEPNNPFKGWTTLEHAAEISGRARSTLRSWVKYRHIEHHTVGKNTTLVNLEEVLRYSAEHPPRFPETD